MVFIHQREHKYHSFIHCGGSFLLILREKPFIRRTKSRLDGQERWTDTFQRSSDNPDDNTQRVRIFPAIGHVL